MTEHDAPVHRLADDLGVIAHELHELDLKLRLALIELGIIALILLALLVLRSIELAG